MDKTSHFRIDAYETTKKDGVPFDSEVANKPSLFQSYQLAPERINPTCVDFRRLSKKRLGFGYSFLTKVEYEPDPANEKIVAVFSSGEVNIRGVNLLFIYEMLLQRKLVWVSEVNVTLLNRYKELIPANDNLRNNVPIVLEIMPL